jgi:3-hydroxyisobutyrate dehydrogenase-like beta-hydroxyacid dehydrogenase
MARHPKIAAQILSPVPFVAPVRPASAGAVSLSSLPTEEGSHPMASVAFCGLGQMGAPMARRLLDAGQDLVVWNRTASKADPLVQRGARRAETPADAVRAVEAAITMLATPDAVDEVLFGPSGAAEAMVPGSTLIEMSTIGPDAVREISGRLPRGVGMLDAPVLGSVREASEGSLRMFVGGPEDLCARWLPILEALGSPRRLGDLGAGAAMKLVANSTLMVLMTGLGEALALADALGLDQGVVLDVLSDSALGVTARGKRSRLETGRYPPNFKVALARKDASLVVETAERAALDLPLAEAARTWMERADEAGLGELDYSAVIARIRGREARLPDAD